MENIFGEKRKLILPIILDIANVVKNASDQSESKAPGSQSKTNNRHRRHAVIHERKMRKKRSDDNLSVKVDNSSEIKFTHKWNISEDDEDSSQIPLGNFVHVTLPLSTNRTMSLEEYEDLVLGELNGTDSVTKSNTNANESLPEPAMLLSNYNGIPIHRHPVYLNPRKCELFGNLCLHVEDYPM